VGPLFSTVASAIAQGFWFVKFKSCGGGPLETPCGTKKARRAHHRNRLLSATLLPYQRSRVRNQLGKLIKLERLVQDLIGLLVDSFGQMLVSGYDDDVNP
jgi:hypothetical protein